MVGVLLLFYALSTIDRFVLALVIDEVKGNLHLSEFEMGILLGPAVALSYAGCGLFFGWAADRYSRRHVIFAGIVLWSLATAACGLADSFWSLFTARAFVGVGEAALLPAAYSLIADGIRPGRVTTAYSIFSAGPKWGQAAAYALGGLILGYFNFVLHGGAHLGGFIAWQLTFLFLGGVGVVLAPLLFTFPDPAPWSAPSAAAKQSVRGFLLFLRRRPLIWLLILGALVMNVVTNAIYTWAPVFVGRTFGWSPAQYGPPIGLLSIIAATAMVGHGRIADFLFNRGGRQDIHIRYYSWVLASSIPLAAGMFFIRNPVAFLITLCVFEILAFPFVMFVMSTFARVVPTNLRGQVTAFLLFGTVISGMTGSPLIVGALTTYLFKDPAKIGWSLGLVATVGCILAFALFRGALGPLNRELSAAGVLGENPGQCAAAKTLAEAS